MYTEVVCKDDEVTAADSASARRQTDPLFPLMRVARAKLSFWTNLRIFVAQRLARLAYAVAP